MQYYPISEEEIRKEIRGALRACKYWRDEVRKRGRQLFRSRYPYEKDLAVAKRELARILPMRHDDGSNVLVQEVDFSSWHKPRWLVWKGDV